MAAPLAMLRSASLPAERRPWAHAANFIAGGLSVLWIELQDRTGFKAGHAQLISDAVIFANWDAAKRLVGRGADVEWWQAAALGLLDRMRTRWDATPPPTREEITRALWHACRGAQRTTTEELLDQGGDPHWVGWDGLTPLAAAGKSGNVEFLNWLRSKL